MNRTRAILFAAAIAAFLSGAVYLSVRGHNAKMDAQMTASMKMYQSHGMYRPR